MSESTSQFTTKIHQHADLIKNIAIGVLIVGLIVLIAICIWLGVENSKCQKRASDLTSEEVSKINVELQRYKDENKNLEGQLLKAKTDFKSCEVELSKNYSLLKQKDSAFDLLNNRYSELTRKIRVLEDYILQKSEAKGSGNLAAIEENLNILINAKQVEPARIINVDFLTYKVYKLLELNAQLKSQIDELQLSLNSCNTEKADLKVQNDKLSSENLDLKKTALKLSSQVTSLTELLAKCSGEKVVIEQSKQDLLLQLELFSLQIKGLKVERDERASDAL